MKNANLKAFLKKADENENAFYEKFLAAIKGGKNNVYHNVISEAVTLEDSWITTMENALFSVEKIVKNPRKFIIDEDLLVDVERARKTTAKTVRHLSSNSQFVQSITDEGEVRPKKLLTTEMNEDLAIYENRFVCTLVHFCVNFVENKYNEIMGTTKSFDQTGAGIISKFNIGTSECELKLDLKVREEPVDKELQQKNEELLDHIEVLRKRLKVLLNTDFIRQLSGKKPVRPPIMKTNLIKMNVDYQRCYKLWLFVSSYTFVGFSVAYQDKNLPVQTDFYDDLTNICAMSFQALMQNNCLNKEDYAKIEAKPLKEKKYRLLTAYKFDPLFNADKEKVGEDSVNEYYFKRMRDELVRATKRNEYEQEKNIQLSFARFTRTIAKINSEMYEDVISSQLPKETEKRGTPLQKKEAAVKRQQAFLKRYRQLSSLKKEELEKILKLEAREVLKLEKLKEEVDKEKGRIKSKKERLKKERERIKNVKAKKALAIKKAKLYEEELREKGEEKMAEIEELKAKKREQAQRRRDLKRLKELKEKYDDRT